ncbi:helix-turn-helix domain-containing protein [Actinokineospora globicatena]|uniref:helix-turn-helix domain-containing protein n=1 Tax=Actinokineospora globicatena TaxID=103729 RepID=UPI0020A343F2|nr:helix-turn-helix transcriptional regulator [Actinokineospora globicatena]MCP2302449.1 hypothetical protein [Actinokineospora globicatena]GLW75868.1 XRE family transcriptional regulator [Actinokineospora globicatena]GLW82706.1 XRE family transcriptional regulator [Actinokineospora globicatena]
MWGDPHERPDPGIWELPAMRAALARRDITAVYRLLKRHGISQRRIALLTGQAQPEVSVIARGRQVMSYDVLDRIAEGMGIPRGHMGLAYGAPGEPADEARDGVVDVPDRREFMGLLAKVAMGAAVTGGDLALLANPAVATPVPNRVGATEVGQLRDLTHMLWAQERALGGGAMREAVIAQLGWARGLLRASHTDVVGRALRAEMSDLLALAGWASHDVGLPGAALRYLGQAVTTAKEADDPVRTASALGKIGRVYTHQRNLDDARDVLGLSLVVADPARSGELTAQLLCNQARAHAEAGTASRAAECLSRAADALATPADQPLSAPDAVFNPTLLASERGRVLTILTIHDRRHAPKAIETLTASNARLDPSRTKRLAFGLTELATCHLRGGDTETGVRLGHQVVDMAAGIRSERLAEHLKLLRAAAHRQPELAQRI